MNSLPFKVNVQMFVKSFPEQENDISGTYKNDKRAPLSPETLQAIKAHRDECSRDLMAIFQPQQLTLAEPKIVQKVINQIAPVCAP